jgi:hypothetical protein
MRILVSPSASSIAHARQPMQWSSRCGRSHDHPARCRSIFRPIPLAPVAVQRRATVLENGRRNHARFVSSLAAGEKQYSRAIEDGAMALPPSLPDLNIDA